MPPISPAAHHPALWWYGDDCPDVAMLNACGVRLLGSGCTQPSDHVQLVVFSSAHAAEAPLCLLRWRQRGLEPALLVCGDATSGVTFPVLPLPPDPRAWASICREVFERRECQRQQQRLRRERDRLNQRLEAAESQLRDRQEELVRLETQASMSQLVRSLAHELNNPLAVIMGNAELIARSHQADERLTRRTQTIIGEVSDCQGIIDRLRRFSRPQGEQPKALKIPEVVGQAVQRLRRRGSPIPDFVLEEPLPMVHCGRGALVRAVEQILDNALRAGGRTITIRADSAERRCHIHLSNDGSTPSDEDIRGACRPFFSGRGAAGLGLSLAVSLLSDYRGTVALAVGPGGKGATTTISVPLWDQEAASREREGASSDDWLPAMSTAATNILVVEDEKLVAELIVLTAEEMGWSVRVAKRIEQAQHEVENWDVHALMVDVNVAGADGIDFLRHLLPQRSDLIGRVAVVTGDHQRPAVQQMVTDWDCRFLGKPFRLQSLRSLLEELRT